MVTRTKKIFVGGLSAATTVEDVKNYFSQYGKVKKNSHLRHYLDGQRGDKRVIIYFLFCVSIVKEKIALRRLYPDGQLAQKGGLIFTILCVFFKKKSKLVLNFMVN